jgi:pteridine reductase
MELAGKIALVTGAARRVGLAIADELAAAGAQVVAHHHGSDAPPDRRFALVHRADLRDPAACASLIEAARARFGRIDLLVNSAASYLRAPFADQDDAAWDDLYSLDLAAPARLIRLALPHGLSSVVNIVDVAARQPWKSHAAYAAMKAGLAQLTRNLALELAPSVRVNGVAPGTVAFPPDFTEEERARITARIPLGRTGAPADVARAVRFLAREDFLTGVILPVDGGASLR